MHQASWSYIKFCIWHRKLLKIGMLVVIAKWHDAIFYCRTCLSKSLINNNNQTIWLCRWERAAWRWWLLWIRIFLAWDSLSFHFWFVFFWTFSTDTHAHESHRIRYSNECHRYWSVYLWIVLNLEQIRNGVDDYIFGGESLYFILILFSLSILAIWVLTNSFLEPHLNAVRSGKKANTTMEMIRLVSICKCQCTISIQC